MKRPARWMVALFAGTTAVAVPQVVLAPSASADPSQLFVAIGGHDVGNCQSQAAPCASIGYAASQAEAYEMTTSTTVTINIGRGTFKANFTPSSNGINIAFQGSRSGSAPATTVEPQSTSTPVFDIGRGGIELDNLTINGMGGVAVSSDYGSNALVNQTTVVDSSKAVCACGPTGTVTVTNSTLTGNTVAADLVDPSASMGISNSTIARNGTGLAEEFSPPVAEYTLVASILAYNHGRDCAFGPGGVTDDGYNLDKDGTCHLVASRHSLSSVSPGPLSLGNNGGPTKTMRPDAGSVVLDKVSKASFCPPTDQRGYARSVPCDMGAVERVHS